MAVDGRHLSAELALEQLRTLKARFERGSNHPRGLEWIGVQRQLEAKPQKLWSLNEMEQTGGEPNVVGYDDKRHEYVFFDCSPESPIGRRNLCYDSEALESRKTFKPGNSAMDMAAAMGAELLTEEQYRELQELGEFDTRSSSWIATPPRSQSARGSAVLRSTLWTRFRISQWCEFLLRFQRISEHPKSVGWRDGGCAAVSGQDGPAIFIAASRRSLK